MPGNTPAFFFLYEKKNFMASKERKGGLLKNEDVEQELERTGAQKQEGQTYRGGQATGDKVVREKGTEVQQEDGAGKPDEDAP